MQKINGRKIADDILENLKNEVAILKTKYDIIPTVAIIQVGNNQASSIYIKNKQKTAEKIGSEANIIKFPLEVSEKEIIEKIISLNDNKKINGILVQLPLPKQINEETIMSIISPSKDVDCFHKENIGNLWSSKNNCDILKPCTPDGIIELIKQSNLPISGKHVVIIGRSNIVGKPLIALFLLENATVTVCHSKTEDLISITKTADILVVAIGKSKFINSKFVKKGACVIDVGINYDSEGKLCGDVDYDSFDDLSGWITPVPGGVGPMTITMLVSNLIKLTKKQHKI
ncbi:MAG: bifunctional 5,10-methylenetetrahydrofolate dehydrogenase/5,10-methenyltetrahydrofolate cyclohydrolase [Mycoplasmataceae bacterium]|nr:bifunctional 5,10-methylenetetrahydrofolate dehydrogenase/5,10-methenyltetrahydrofolate cyclohydrolase [Mycoplasmataceae bacterium]